MFHWRHSVWVTCLAVLAGNVTLFSATGLMDADAQSMGFSSKEHLVGMILLMTLMPMWLLGCFIKTQRHSLVMAQSLDQGLAEAVVAMPARYALMGVMGGTFYALAFNVPRDHVDQLLAGSGPMFSVFAGQLLIWICVGFLLSIRLYVGKLFYLLGKEIEVSIFEQSRLEPFARVGMLDVVIVVGGMAVATVQSIDAQFRLENYLTAFLVAIPAAIALLIRPMWAVHKRLRDRRNELLAEVRQQIETTPERGSHSEIATLELLLTRRDRIKALHTWPLDVAIWSRLLFYVLIPPIAWSGAALVEVIIGRMLGT